MYCTLLKRWSMVLAIDMMHGRDPVNKMRQAILAVYIIAKGIYAVHY